MISRTKYRKKPVTVEAMQLAGSNAEIHAVYLWVESHVGSFDPLDDEVPIKGISIDPTTGGILIATLEGVMKAKIGHWIIKGVHGEFYPCDPDIFEETYEAAELRLEKRDYEHLQRKLEQLDRENEQLKEELRSEKESYETEVSSWAQHLDALRAERDGAEKQRDIAIASLGEALDALERRANE